METIDAWKAFSVSFALLFGKALTTSIYQAHLRIKTKSFVSPEDAHWMRTKAVAGDTPQLQRVSAVWSNDSENIPYFLILALVYVLLGCWPDGAAPYFMLFVLFRYAHTVAYLRGVQPLRFISYIGGVIVSCILLGHVVYRAFVN